jgi:hypothetical protein
MMLKYIIDNASCAGYIFSLYSFVYDSLLELWNTFDNRLKSSFLFITFLKCNGKNSFVGENSIAYHSESEGDSDSD